MTDRAEIERLLNQTGRTLEGLPTQDGYLQSEDCGARYREIGEAMYAAKFVNNVPFMIHQSDVIELLVGALRDALDKQPKWISVKERLPENEERVLITERHDGFYGKPWCIVMTAFHTDGKTHAEDSDYNWSEGSVEMQYDEEADDFIVPEGWWEDVQCGDEFSMVEAKVTHWMPLPEPQEEESNA